MIFLKQEERSFIHKFKYNPKAVALAKPLLDNNNFYKAPAAGITYEISPR